MIVDIMNTKWEPMDLKIRFETRQEFDDFKEMIRHCDTVPDAIIEYGSKIDRNRTYNLMSHIYNKMV